MTIAIKNHITVLLCVASVLLVLISFFGCSQYQDRTNELSDRVTDNMNIIPYCAKEKNEGSRIFFNYPQLREAETQANEINKIIDEYVKESLQILEGGFEGNLKDSPEIWKWDEDEYMLRAMYVEYNITRNDLEYISITFEGDYHHKMTPHPSHCFYALTIDKINEKAIFIDDLYHIDDEFIKLFQRKVNEQAREGLARRLQMLPEDIPDKIIEQILDTANGIMIDDFTGGNVYSRNFFLVDEAVGLSIKVPYAIGDHFEIFVSYDELQQFRNK